MAESLQFLRDRDPDLADTLEGTARALRAQGIGFCAMDASDESLGSGSPAWLGVSVESLPLQVSLDTYVLAALRRLDSMPMVVRPASHRRVLLRAGPAGEFRYQARVESSGGQALLLTETDYAVVRGKEAYGLNFVANVDQAEEYALVFEKVARTFDFK